MARREPRGPGRLWRASVCSFKGLAAAFRHEPAFRLELYVIAVLAPLALWLGRSGLERAVLVGSLLLVLIVEMLNSAIESVVDKASPEQHELAGRAKDMGSATVMLALLNVLACWLLILLPQLPRTS